MSDSQRTEPASAAPVNLVPAPPEHSLHSRSSRPSSRRHSPGSDSAPPAKSASYLIRRRGILFFRSHIPDELRPVPGRTKYRRSLNTARLSEARPVALRLAVAVQDVYALARAYNSHTNGQETHNNMLNLKDIQALDRVHIQSLADEWLHGALTNANAFTLRVGGER